MVVCIDTNVLPGMFGRAFDVLKNSGYKPRPITPEEFIARHLAA